MNIEHLRFRAISHMPEGELVQILSTYNANSNQISNKVSLGDRPADKGLQARRHTGSTAIQSSTGLIRNQVNTKDSIIESFADSNRNIEVSRIKEECSKLRFQKIALQNSLQRLKQQIVKKDEIIRGLTNQVSNGNVQSMQGLRHSLVPHY